MKGPHKSKKIKWVLFIASLAILLFALFFKARQESTATLVDSSYKLDLEIDKKIEEKVFDQLVITEDKKEIQKKGRIPVGSEITPREIRALVKRTFPIIDDKLSDDYECPVNNEKYFFPFGQNGKHCRKKMIKFGLELSVSNSFQDNEYYQFLLSIDSINSHPGQTVFSMRFEDQGLLSMSFVDLYGSSTCFEIEFKDNAVWLFQTEEDEDAINHDVQTAFKGEGQRDDYRKKLHSDVKGKIRKLMVHLCTEFLDKRACALGEKIDGFNCGESL